MEAANRGASEAAGISIGLGISLPTEATANPYITRELAFEFHYFFMRKFWFVYLAKALVVFPGGFGTLDELFELLTLMQTGKIGKRMPIVLYGREFWEDVLQLRRARALGHDLRGRPEPVPHLRRLRTRRSRYLEDELTRLYLGPGAGSAGE